MLQLVISKSLQFNYLLIFLFTQDKGIQHNTVTFYIDNHIQFSYVKMPFSKYTFFINYFWGAFEVFLIPSDQIMYKIFKILSKNKKECTMCTIIYRAFKDLL